MEVGGERLIGVALGAAQLVIQMGNGDGKGRRRGTRRQQGVQQRDAVRPAGDGRHDAAGVVFQGPHPAAHSIDQSRRNMSP